MLGRRINPRLGSGVIGSVAERSEDRDQARGSLRNLYEPESEWSHGPPGPSTVRTPTAPPIGTRRLVRHAPDGAPARR